MLFHAFGSFALVEQSERRLPPLRSVLSLDVSPITMPTMWNTQSRSDASPRSSIVPAMTILALLLSVWRVTACFTEYNDGPFVTLAVALVDMTPFLALAFSIVALCCWRQSRRMTHYCSVAVIGLLAVTTCDLVVFSATFRSRLHTGSWTGRANISSGDGAPIIKLTFTNDDNAVISLGDAGHTQIYSGSWQTSFDSYLARPKEVQFPGFGRAEYLKGDRLHIQGIFRSRGTSNQIVAVLQHSPAGLK